MRRTRIKICGLTRAEDVAAAIAAGADACGFIFAPSPRRVTIGQAAELTALVPPPVARVGVFVDADESFVTEAVARCGLTAVQFAGSESPERCAATPEPVIKVLKVGPGFDWSEAEPYRGSASALLLDTLVPGMAGGTSKAFDWRAIGPDPAWALVFVAGGLSPDNIGDCIVSRTPYAVDVSSGVETAPGIKDAEKIEAFCADVRRADEEMD